jgi:two-component system nitrate/nitrite response regulator NarL
MAVVATPTVVIADDHVPTRTSVCRVLEDAGFKVVAEVGDADGAIRACRDKMPAVAILDVRMPGNGVRAAEIIKAELPTIEVLMLTISDEDSDLFAALAAGASGYWLKGQDLQLIPGLIHQVLAGDIVLSDSLVRPIVKGWRDRHASARLTDNAFPGVRFSSRESNVIELLAAGLTTAEIGSRLFIADVTVRTHIATILKKVRVDDRSEFLSRLHPPAGDGALGVV